MFYSDRYTNEKQQYKDDDYSQMRDEKSYNSKKRSGYYGSYGEQYGSEDSYQANNRDEYVKRNGDRNNGYYDSNRYDMDYEKRYNYDENYPMEKPSYRTKRPKSGDYVKRTSARH